jgi:hypothetical protein
MATPNWIAAVYDGGLDYISANATRVHVCSAEPANYAGIAAVQLAVYTISGANFTKAAGDVSGRKITLGAQSGNSATAAGNGTHLAFSNGSSTMYGVIAGDGDAISNGQIVNIAAVDVLEIRAAT